MPPGQCSPSGPSGPHYPKTPCETSIAFHGVSLSGIKVLRRLPFGHAKLSLDPQVVKGARASQEFSLKGGHRARQHSFGSGTASVTTRRPGAAARRAMLRAVFVTNWRLIAPPRDEQIVPKSPPSAAAYTASPRQESAAPPCAPLGAHVHPHHFRLRHHGFPRCGFQVSQRC